MAQGTNELVKFITGQRLTASSSKKATSYDAAIIGVGETLIGSLCSSTCLSTGRAMIGCETSRGAGTLTSGTSLEPYWETHVKHAYFTVLWHHMIRSETGGANGDKYGCTRCCRRRRMIVALPVRCCMYCVRQRLQAGQKVADWISRCSSRSSWLAPCVGLGTWIPGSQGP